MMVMQLDSQPRRELLGTSAFKEGVATMAVNKRNPKGNRTKNGKIL
jgi:hypothetical protein